MPESKWPLITISEAQQLILDHTPILPPVRRHFTDALNCVLAEDIYATEDMPPFACSAKDGYAVVAADTSPVRRLVGDQMAGYVAGVRVTPGAAARITTGAPIPPGADAVIMVEHTEEHDGQVVIHRRVRPGDDVRPPGQDIPRGQLVLPRGTLLGPPELGLLATMNRTEVLVHPHPMVAVLSTGDEVVEPGQPLRPGQIRDSNRYTLMAALRQAGCQSLDLGIARDRPGELEALIGRGLDEADALLTSGGVSMGQLDLVKPLLEQLGQIHFGRVYTKPGKPVTFATVGSKLAFAMPGFPVSALVSFEMFVRPALLKMQGRTRLHRPRRMVVLRHDVQHTEDRTEFQRAVVTREDGVYYATTTGYQGSGRLLSMVGANALLELPVGQGNFPAGSVVEAVLLGEID
jgi:molybdenum cofactor synthesis domain-containing protein